MRAGTILLVALVALLGSCKDDDPKFSSAEGTWTYTTPDSKIGVEFELKQNGTQWDVINPLIIVDGTRAEAAVVASNVEPPAIGSIRINANDTKITYAYFILFSELEVSGDFKEIKGPGATYTWPYDKTNNLTDVTITRK